MGVWLAVLRAKLHGPARCKPPGDNGVHLATLFQDCILQVHDLSTSQHICDRILLSTSPIPPGCRSIGELKGFDLQNGVGAAIQEPCRLRIYVLQLPRRTGDVVTAGEECLRPERV